MSILGWISTDNLVVQLQRVWLDLSAAERAFHLDMESVVHTLVGAIWLQIPSEFLAVTIELALVLFSTFADKVIIRDGKLYPLYKDWNLEVLSSSFRHFLLHGANSQIATQVNPHVRDTCLMGPIEAIKCSSPTGQSRKYCVNCKRR